MSDDIKRIVRDFIARELRPGFALKDDESLLDNGIIDSRGVTELVAFIEDRFGLELGPDELDDPATFETISTIAALVASKKG